MSADEFQALPDEERSRIIGEQIAKDRAVASSLASLYADGRTTVDVEEVIESIREALVALFARDHATASEYPDWALQRYVKFLFLTKLDLLDKESVTYTYESLWDEDLDVESELDRCIEEQGMTEYAELVQQEVLIARDDSRGG